MAQGVSLHIGLNAVDPDYYEGWSGPLMGCKADAEDMYALAKIEGYTSEMLINSQATRDKVRSRVLEAASRLRSGDIFFWSYSGHGGFVPDVDMDEKDRRDETWCLYDGELIDDEIRYLHSNFAEGVRILLLSDSCHSGTVLKNQRLTKQRRGDRRVLRAMPPEVAQDTYSAHRQFYDDIGSDPRVRASRGNVKASVILISGCQDNQLSEDGLNNGLFTTRLKEVWNDGQFSGGYQIFHKMISLDMPAEQTPNLEFDGNHDEKFLSQRPFMIASSGEPDGCIKSDKKRSDPQSVEQQPVRVSRTEVSMPDYLSTIYTSVTDTWGSLLEETKLSRDDFLAINPHVTELDEIVPGIPLDIPNEVRKARLRAHMTRDKAKKSPYAIAREELLKNVSEIPGSQTNPRIAVYHATTIGGAEPDEVAWCSSFVNYCVEQAGSVGTDSKAARSWHNKKWGDAVDKGKWREGDIIVFWRVAKNDWRGHVGFLVSFDGPRPEVLGGNQSGRLSIATPYPYTQILSVRRWG